MNEGTVAGEAPEAKPQFINDLISRIDKGDIKLPAFQREFVWKPAQVLELFDSMLRGYPIGSLLLWRTNVKLADQRDIGGFELPSPPAKYPTNYVLDGQQRLTSVYGAHSYSGDQTEEHIFNVAYDLVDESFFHPTGEPKTTWLPVRTLRDMSGYMEFQKQLDKSHPELVNKADEIRETLRGYAVPVVTIMAPVIEDVASIFERINSTGTRLTLFDLMVAATWSENFFLRDEIEGLMSELEKKRFGDVSPGAILNVMSALTEGSAKRASILDLQKRTPEELASAITKTSEAAKKAVDLLATDLHVPSDDFLPYERQFVALAHVLATLPKSIDAAAIALLRRWFWRTSFSERYRRGGEGLLDEDLASLVSAVKKRKASPPPDLSAFGRSPDASVFQGSPFRKGSALTSAFVALLAQNTPRNLVDGSEIDTVEALSTYNRREFHHIFPQAFLRKQGIVGAKASCLANFCMLSADQNKEISARAPSEYFTALKEAHGEAFGDILAANLIPEAALPHIQSDDFESFVSVRSAHIASAVDQLLS